MPVAPQQGGVGGGLLERSPATGHSPLSQSLCCGSAGEWLALEGQVGRLDCASSPLSLLPPPLPPTVFNSPPRVLWVTASEVLWCSFLKMLLLC